MKKLRQPSAHRGRCSHGRFNPQEVASFCIFVALSFHQSLLHPGNGSVKQLCTNQNRRTVGSPVVFRPKICRHCKGHHTGFASCPLRRHPCGTSNGFVSVPTGGTRTRVRPQWPRLWPWDQPKTLLQDHMDPAKPVRL